MKNFLRGTFGRAGHFVTLTSLLLALAPAARAMETNAPSVPGELLVKLKVGSALATVQAPFSALGLTEMRRLSGSMSGLSLYRLADESKTEEVLAKLKAHPLVEYAQPNYVIQLVQNTEALPAFARAQNLAAEYCRPGTGSLCAQLFAESPSRPAVMPPPAAVSPPIPDPQVGEQYNIGLTNANQAWSITPGSSSVVVAVIDSGIDYNHEDLAYNMWRNPSPSGKQDYVGFDTLSQNGLPYDDDEINGHGTHAAGIVGAVGGNGKGIVGVNQRVSLMALKAFSAYAYGTTESIVAAMAYGVDHGARILSASWATGKKDNPALIDSIMKARDKGVLLVAAAGNSHNDDDRDDTAEYPAGYRIDNIIAVASVDSNDRLADSSGYGATTVLLAAPGVNIYSTLPGSKYGWESGTSMATPHVAGAAALLWAKNPQWTYLQVKQALASSVDAVGDLGGKTISGGRLNVFRALQVKF